MSYSPTRNRVRDRTRNAQQDNIDKPEIFMQTVLENSTMIQNYRRQTPFVGILTLYSGQVVTVFFAGLLDTEFRIFRI